MLSAMKSFGATTGLQPFNLNRISFIMAFSVAALVIAKLVDAYLFCGFNKNFFVDLPFGVALFVCYCFTPLLGLAINRKPTTKRGRCCRTFAIVLISIWLFVNYFAIIAVHAWVPTMGMKSAVAHDPFNVCGNRTIDNIRKQFSNATATFDILERIDLVYKSAVGLGWFVLSMFAFAGFLSTLIGVAGPLLNQPDQKKDLESGKTAEDNSTTIVWMEESGEGQTEEQSAVAEHGSIDIEDESAPADSAQEAEDRTSEDGSVIVRMENLRNEINEPGSNAEPQSKEAKEPKFSIVDEEKEETATTEAANEDPK